MRTRKKFFLLFITSLIVVFVYSHLQLKTVYTWSAPKNEAASIKEEITAVTYNIRYGKGLDGKVNLRRTIEKLKKFDADIISLQEVERYSVRSLFSDQVMQIAKALNMNVVFYPTLSYPGLYYGNVILTKFPIEKSDVLVFKNSGEDRSAIVAKLNLPSNEKLYVINTHLGLNKTERLVAIEEIYQLIKGKNKPILLMGDLNSTPLMNEYESWNDILTKSNQGVHLQTFYKRDWQIDYIFHSQHFFVDRVTVNESDASDHYPVIATLSILD